MTLDLAYEQATLFAHDLPDHAGQLAAYTAAGLKPDVAMTLEKRAARIQTLGRQTILEIGTELVAAREEAAAGTWGKFLERCGLTERTAENYMNVVRKFAKQPGIISALPPTALYAMAAPGADQDVVGEIIAEVADGAEPTVSEVKQRLSAARPSYTPVQPVTVPEADDEEGKDESVAPPYTPSDGTPQVTHVAAHTRTVQTPAPAPVALPPTLNITPAAATLPPVLSIGQPTPAQSGVDVNQRKIQIAKLQLLREALALVEAEAAAVENAPIIVIAQERAQQAARDFVSGQGLGAAAAMLAFSATVDP